MDVGGIIISSIAIISSVAGVTVFFISRNKERSVGAEALKKVNTRIDKQEEALDELRNEIRNDWKEFFKIQSMK